MASNITNKAIRTLSPLIGEFLARIKVRAACIRAGLDMDCLEECDDEQFISNLEMILKHGFGDDMAQTVKYRLKIS